MNEQFNTACDSKNFEEKLNINIRSLVEQMTLSEKLGQLSQFSGNEGHVSDELAQQIRAGNVGSVINEVDVETVNELQRIAVEESPLGIPLLIGRDVIHGFKTIFPIPLGQAATWDTELIAESAKVSALEAAASGVNWTFAPMVDISRDPRWGRIAESLGEDPYLCSMLGAAMVEGFQGTNMADLGSIAACAKHFAGYGASESGRDYNTTNIPENELRNVYLKPFHAAVKADVATLMSSFSDLNGVPASGNEWLMKDILRDEWSFDGTVVSDWDSIRQLSIHGYTESDKESAFEAITAGIDMEMVSQTYLTYGKNLLDENRITIDKIDKMVTHVLELKNKLGLFESPYTSPSSFPEIANQNHLSLAQDVATKSCVLLKNNNILPLSKNDLSSIALIGPLANDGYEQLGTWIFDGDEKHSVTVLSAMEAYVGDEAKINFAKGVKNSRSINDEHFSQAIDAATNADVAVMVLGEESILSGEAHCRTNINLPGMQEQLIDAIAKTSTPIVLVIMAGRPITLETVIDKVDAILFAWHPGTMAGPAITSLLFGEEVPSGKLPVTFPRNVGQIPIYYAHKNTGKPASNQPFIHMNDIPDRAPQTSLGMTAAYLDSHFLPRFPFGFGMSYTVFSYKDMRINKHEFSSDETIEIEVEVTNTGNYNADEVVQLYIRDLVGSVTRPIKELKRFKRIHLFKDQTKSVRFLLTSEDLSFYDRKMHLTTEAGKFHVWVGGDSTASLHGEFELINK